jgi:hypothetical protein
VIRGRALSRLGPLFAGGLALAGCGAKEPSAMVLPDPPAPIERPAEYAFGDTVAAQEERLAGDVDRVLRTRFGKPIETHLTAPAGTDFAAISRWYGEKAQGWQPLPEVATMAKAGGGSGFGFAQGDHALVLLWLPALPGASHPVTLLRYR